MSEGGFFELRVAKEGTSCHDISLSETASRLLSRVSDTTSIREITVCVRSAV